MAPAHPHATGVAVYPALFLPHVTVTTISELSSQGTLALLHIAYTIEI